MTCTVLDCGVHVRARGLCGRHYQRLRNNGTTDLLRVRARCSVVDCDRAARGRGLCGKHYQRLMRLDRLDLPAEDIGERLRVGHLVDANGCWIWQGKPDPGGYGHFGFEGLVLYVHRVAYEHYIGPIPDALTIDHLCQVRLCINPEHLEPVTAAENARRVHARRKEA